MLKKFLKIFIPNKALQGYHKTLAILASVLFRFPSEKLIVIGVTGTNGKSTTSEMIASILEEAGFKVGLASTIKFKIGNDEKPNTVKMTMIGRLKLQGLIRKMVNAGCDYAVIETTSQGIAQYRHTGINYDVAVFTNITPEHIESHGSFENYKKAKGKLFSHLTKMKKKTFKGKEIQKISIVNIDDVNCGYFLQKPADIKYGYSIQRSEYNEDSKVKVRKAEGVIVKEDGLDFKVNDIKIALQFIGKFNVYNALAAYCVGLSQDVSADIIKAGLEKIDKIQGRMEYIDNDKGIKVVVDYAHEPQAVRLAYETLLKIKENRIIHILGSCGGGRDVSRREILGEIAGKNSDIAIITNEDPYDDDPLQIIKDVANGSAKAGMLLGKNLFIINDRKEAIKKSLQLAQKDDIIYISGKGSEQVMAVGNKLVPWDDRKVVKELLEKM